MDNHSKIKGNKNVVVQGTRKSQVNVSHDKVKGSGNNKYAIIAIIIAAVGVIATIIIGWDNIINFFK